MGGDFAEQRPRLHFFFCDKAAGAERADGKDVHPGNVVGYNQIAALRYGGRGGDVQPDVQDFERFGTYVGQNAVAGFHCGGLRPREEAALADDQAAEPPQPAEALENRGFLVRHGRFICLIIVSVLVCCMKL